MKSLYIIAFLALSLNIYAQENKKSDERSVQEVAYYKESKEFEAKMMSEAKEKTNQKPSSGLVSDQGLEVNKEEVKSQNQKSGSGKLLPNTASMDEILASIPERQGRKAVVQQNSQEKNVQGIIAGPDFTIYDLKKTIPKK